MEKNCEIIPHRKTAPFWSPWFLVTIATAILTAQSVRAGLVVPVDGMVITENTTFQPGTYNLPNGISIGASDITLDMNGDDLVNTSDLLLLFSNWGPCDCNETGSCLADFNDDGTTNTSDLLILFANWG